MYAIKRKGEKHIIKFYGIISDAYRFYNIADFTVKGCEKYKISDKKQCAICYEETAVYNFCKQDHHDGICLECIEKLKSYYCPFCRDKLIFANKKCYDEDDLIYI